MACVEDCLKDYIGITGCGREEPASCLYINSLPGMSIKNFDALTDKESPTYLNVWDDIQKRAQVRFKMDLYAELNKRWKIFNITNSLDLGKKYDATSITTHSAQYRGIVKDLDFGLDNEQIKYSALQTQYIQTLYYYSPIVQNGSVIKVFDLDLSVEIDSFTKNFVIGWNTIAVNKNYSQRRIFIGVDSTNIDSVALHMPTTAEYKPNDITRAATVNIVTGNADFSTIVYGSNTFGLSGILGTRCKWDSLICNNLDVFAQAYWYCLGSEATMERLASNRVNFITVDRKQADELKLNYDDKYAQALSQAALNIEFDESDSCIDCNELLTIKESSSFHG